MSIILGIDEVGRGPLAGPLVVGAVVLKTPIEGLKDSKQLTKKRREELNVVIRTSGAAIGLGWVSAVEINEIGLSYALRRATKLAVQQIEVAYNEIIIDGTVNFLADTNKGRYVNTMKKADQLIASVSAASIVAKVARDAYMISLPDDKYGFKDHVGYGTKKHLDAIKKYGPCTEHRTRYAPFNNHAVVESTAVSNTTKNIGDKAENQAAVYLEHLGHMIIERNWKTKFCEIDIISQK
ncbi:ribonuclease HII, partial [Candidatus Saccharibacteria bacterium]|nr:ribonuclease HII [Candidatus Saccharibacteria bacterium]